MTEEKPEEVLLLENVTNGFQFAKWAIESLSTQEHLPKNVLILKSLSSLWNEILSESELQFVGELTLSMFGHTLPSELVDYENAGSCCAQYLNILRVISHHYSCVNTDVRLILLEVIKFIIDRRRAKTSSSESKDILSRLKDELRDMTSLNKIHIHQGEEENSWIVSVLWEQMTGGKTTFSRLRYFFQWVARRKLGIVSLLLHACCEMAESSKDSLKTLEDILRMTNVCLLYESKGEEETRREKHLFVQLVSLLLQKCRSVKHSAVDVLGREFLGIIQKTAAFVMESEACIIPLLFATTPFADGEFGDILHGEYLIDTPLSSLSCEPGNEDIMVFVDIWKKIGFSEMTSVDLSLKQDSYREKLLSEVDIMMQVISRLLQSPTRQKRTSPIPDTRSEDPEMASADRTDSLETVFSTLFDVDEPAPEPVKVAQTETCISDLGYRALVRLCSVDCSGDWLLNNDSLVKVLRDYSQSCSSSGCKNLEKTHLSINAFLNRLSSESSEKVMKDMCELYVNDQRMRYNEHFLGLMCLSMLRCVDNPLSLETDIMQLWEECLATFVSSHAKKSLPKSHCALLLGFIIMLPEKRESFVSQLTSSLSSDLADSKTSVMSSLNACYIGIALLLPKARLQVSFKNLLSSISSSTGCDYRESISSMLQLVSSSELNGSTIISDNPKLLELIWRHSFSSLSGELSSDNADLEIISYSISSLNGFLSYFVLHKMPHMNDDYQKVFWTLCRLRDWRKSSLEDTDLVDSLRKVIEQFCSLCDIVCASKEGWSNIQMLQLGISLDVILTCAGFAVGERCDTSLEEACSKLLSGQCPRILECINRLLEFFLSSLSHFLREMIPSGEHIARLGVVTGKTDVGEAWISHYRPDVLNYFRSMNEYLSVRCSVMKNMFVQVFNWETEGFMTGLVPSICSMEGMCLRSLDNIYSLLLTVEKLPGVAHVESEVLNRLENTCSMSGVLGFCTYAHTPLSNLLNENDKFTPSWSNMLTHAGMVFSYVLSELNSIDDSLAFDILKECLMCMKRGIIKRHKTDECHVDEILQSVLCVPLQFDGLRRLHALCFSTVGDFCSSGVVGGDFAAANCGIIERIIENSSICRIKSLVSAGLSGENDSVFEFLRMMKNMVSLESVDWKCVPIDFVLGTECIPLNSWKSHLPEIVGIVTRMTANNVHSCLVAHEHLLRIVRKSESSVKIVLDSLSKVLSLCPRVAYSSKASSEDAVAAPQSLESEKRSCFQRSNVEPRVKSISSDGELILPSQLCTFSQTGRDFVKQHWYHCNTCGLTGSNGVCSVCAEVCHGDHDLTYERKSRFYCDCGDSSSCCALVAQFVPSSSSNDSSNTLLKQYVIDSDEFLEKNVEERDDLKTESVSPVRRLETGNVLYSCLADAVVDPVKELKSLFCSSKKMRTDVSLFSNTIQGDCSVVESVAYESSEQELSEICECVEMGILSPNCLASRSPNFIVCACGATLRFLKADNLSDMNSAKHSLTSLGSYCLHFQPLLMRFNAFCDDFLAVSGLERCSIVHVDKSGCVERYVGLDFSTQFPEFIVEVLWIPNSSTKLAIVTNQKLNFFDTSHSCKKLFSISLPEEEVLIIVAASAVLDGDFVNLVVMCTSGDVLTAQLPLNLGKCEVPTLRKLNLPDRWTGRVGRGLCLCEDLDMMWFFFGERPSFLGRISTEYSNYCGLRCSSLTGFPSSIEPVVVLESEDANCQLLPLHCVAAWPDHPELCIGLCNRGEIAAIGILEDSAAIKPLALGSENVRGFSTLGCLSEIPYLISITEDAKLRISSIRNSMLPSLRRNPLAEKVTSRTLNYPSFPLHIFEKTSLSTSISFRSDDCPSSSVVLTRKLRDPDSDTYVTASGPFTLQVVNLSSTDVIVALRVYLGRDPESIPRVITVCGREYITQPNCPRFYDIALAASNIITSDRKVSISFGETHSGEQTPRVDAVLVYTMSKAQLNWTRAESDEDSSSVRAKKIAEHLTSILQAIKGYLSSTLSDDLSSKESDLQNLQKLLIPLVCDHPSSVLSRVIDVLASQIHSSGERVRIVDECWMIRAILLLQVVDKIPSLFTTHALDRLRSVLIKHASYVRWDGPWLHDLNSFLISTLPKLMRNCYKSCGHIILPQLSEIIVATMLQNDFTSHEHLSALSGLLCNGKLQIRRTVASSIQKAILMLYRAAVAKQSSLFNMNKVGTLTYSILGEVSALLRNLLSVESPVVNVIPVFQVYFFCLWHWMRSSGIGEKNHVIDEFYSLLDFCFTALHSSNSAANANKILFLEGATCFIEQLVDTDAGGDTCLYFVSRLPWVVIGEFVERTMSKWTDSIPENDSNGVCIECSSFSLWDEKIDYEQFSPFLKRFRKSKCKTLKSVLLDSSQVLVSLALQLDYVTVLSVRSCDLTVNVRKIDNSVLISIAQKQDVPVLSKAALKVLKILIPVASLSRLLDEARFHTLLGSSKLLVENVVSACELAQLRKENWENFIASRPGVFSNILKHAIVTDDCEADVLLLKMATDGVSDDFFQSISKNMWLSRAEIDGFIRRSCLGSESSAVREHACSFVSKCIMSQCLPISSFLADSLMNLMKSSRYGGRSEQFFSMMTHLVSSGKLPDSTLENIFLAVKEALHMHNLELQSDPNSHIYRKLEKLVQLRNFLLDLKPCSICNAPSVSFKEGSLHDMAQEKRFSDSSAFFLLSCPQSIREVSLSIENSSGEKMLRCVKVHYSNRQDIELTELKRRPDLWQCAGSRTLKRCQPAVKMNFVPPLIASAVQIEYADLFEIHDASSELLCPRCGSTVTEPHGNCSSCHENAYQCRQCRNVNYDNPDCLMCNECGFSKHINVKISIECKPCFDVYRIKTDDEQKAVETIVRKSSHEAHTCSEQLKELKEDLNQRLAAVASGSLVDASESGMGADLMAIGHLYSEECASVTRSLSRASQTLSSARKQLAIYKMKNVESFVNVDVSIRKMCYGCSAATVSFLSDFLHTAMSNDRCRRIIYGLNLESELFQCNLHTHNKESIRKLLCELAKDSSQASSVLNSLIRERIFFALGNHVAVDVQGMVVDDVRLLVNMASLNDSMWEQRLKLTIDIILRVMKECPSSSVVMDDILVPCMRILIRYCASAKTELKQLVGGLHCNTMFPLWGSNLIRFDQWKESHSSEAAGIETRNLMLSMKYGSKWLKAVFSRGKSEGNWIRNLLFSSSSSLIRSVTTELLDSLVGDTDANQQVILVVLWKMMHKSLSDDVCAEDYFKYMMKLLVSERNKLFFTARGLFRDLVLHMHDLILRIQERERTFSMDTDMHETLTLVANSIRSFLDIPTILIHFRKQMMLTTCIEDYILLKSLVLQRSKLLTDVEKSLLSIIKQVGWQSQDGRTFVLGICMELLMRNICLSQEDSTSILELMKNTICPPKEETTFFLQFRPTEFCIDFIRFEMSKSQYASTEFGPLMRDVKNRLCRDLELHGLMEDDFGLELLVCEKIVKLDLPVELVFEHIWKRLSDTPEAPMLVVYRLQGLEGEAEEEIIESLESSSEVQDEEETFDCCDSSEVGNGIEHLISRVNKIETGESTNASYAYTLLQVLFYCSNVPRNRRKMLKLDAINILLNKIRGAFSTDDFTSHAELSLLTVQNVVREIDFEKSDTSFSRQKSFIYEYDHDEMMSQINLLIDKLESPSISSKSPVVPAITSLIPFLIHGDIQMMTVFVKRFAHHMKWEEFARGECQNSAFLVQCFTHVLENIENNDVVPLNLCVGEVCPQALKYLHESLISVDTSDPSSIEEFLHVQSIPLVLDWIRAVIQKDVVTRKQFLQSGSVEILHEMQEKCKKKILAAPIALLLDACEECDDMLGDLLRSLRKQSKERKKKKAKRRQAAVLKDLGLQQSDDGSITSSFMFEGMTLSDSIFEEEAYSCCMCKEGYRSRPEEVLCVYVFSKPVDLRGPLTDGSQQVYSVVTNFTLIHASCHRDARRSDSELGKSEWEGATIRNQRAPCNNILPLLATGTDRQAHNLCLTEFWSTQQSILPISMTNSRLLIQSIRLILSSVFDMEVFEDNAQRGGRESNVALIAPLVQLVLMTVDELQPEVRQEMEASLSKFLCSSYEEFTAYCGQTENTEYFLVLSVVFLSKADWKKIKSMFFERVLMESVYVNAAQMLSEVSSLDDFCEKYMESFFHKPKAIQGLAILGAVDLLHNNLKTVEGSQCVGASFNYDPTEEWIVDLRMTLQDNLWDVCDVLKGLVPKMEEFMSFTTLEQYTVHVGVKDDLTHDENLEYFVRNKCNNARDFLL